MALTEKGMELLQEEMEERQHLLAQSEEAFICSVLGKVMEVNELIDDATLDEIKDEIQYFIVAQ